jgi:hypothetical protein
MAKFFVAAAAIVVLLFLAAIAVLSSCQDDWCMVFQWQKVRAATTFSDCERLGFPVQESYPRVCRAGDKSFTEPISDEFDGPTESENIKVTSPIPGAEVGGQMTLRGEARVFENVVSYRVKDETGKVVTSGTVMANAPDTGQFGPFEKEITFTKPVGTKLSLEVFQASARDGSDTDKVILKLRLAP